LVDSERSEKGQVWARRSTADVQIGLETRVGGGPTSRPRGRVGFRAEAGLYI
jgi:hypothetical protein